VKFSEYNPKLDGFYYHTQTLDGKKFENWNTPEPESILRQEGNFERNTKNRVRCVRKHANTKIERDKKDE
jgi:hypothetical protein